KRVKIPCRHVGYSSGENAMKRLSDTLSERAAQTATGVSWGGARRPQEGKRFRASWAPAALARGSLLVCLAMASGGCLVTSVPDYVEPQRTAPFLIAESASPDIRQPLEILFDSSQGKYPPQEFRVHVRSEDTGDLVHFKLYVDYGTV